MFHVLCFMNELIFDIETQNLFGPSRDPRELKVSVVGIFDYEANEFNIYNENELPLLFSKMRQARRIIGYNIKGFDLPVLNNYCQGDLLKLVSFDLMEEVVRVLGWRPKLDDLAHDTLGVRKSGDGLQAVKFWQEGRLEELKKYCLDDVKITRDLYEYGQKNGHVKLYDRFTGQIREIPVKFTSPKLEVVARNLTLF